MSPQCKINPNLTQQSLLPLNYVGNEENLITLQNEIYRRNFKSRVVGDAFKIFDIIASGDYVTPSGAPSGAVETL